MCQRRNTENAIKERAHILTNNHSHEGRQEAVIGHSVENMIHFHVVL